jgi:hypothetical protein
MNRSMDRHFEIPSGLESRVQAIECICAHMYKRLLVEAIVAAHSR